MRTVDPLCKLCQLQVWPLSPVNQRCTVCTTQSCASCIEPQGLCHKLSATRVPCLKLVQFVPQAGPQSTLWLQLPLLGDHSFKLTSKTRRGFLCHPILRQLFLGLHVVLRSAKYPINDMQIIKKCHSLALRCACHCPTGNYRVLANSVQSSHQFFSAKAKS